MSKTDPDDISLGNGKRIFVESKSYKTFIDKVESDPRYNKNEKPVGVVQLSAQGSKRLKSFSARYLQWFSCG